ncbi:MAG: GcvT family protein [Actinomycetes bacterium]
MSQQPTSRELPATASAVIIGAGIVGNSLAYHLAELGWEDLVLIDKGPLPNPGGSTGHASNFIFPVDHSREMTLITQDSVRQCRELGVFTQSGGVEVARTPERVVELRRRMSSALAWGEPAELLSPAEVAKLVPFLDDSRILAGFSSPGVGTVDSLRAGTIMRERAVAAGRLSVVPATEILGIDVEAGRVTGVRTTSGMVRTATVVIAAGVWSPRLARMAGVEIPLTPAVHQMISVGPVPLFADTVGEIAYPIVRDMDTGMYERQHGGDLEVGSYAHRPILLDPDEIPAIGGSLLSPTEMPFTEEDFALQMEQALELCPSVLGDERVGIRYAINGLLSLTPDAFPVLGPVPDVHGLWSAAAVWIKEAPGVARAVAEWMTHGHPWLDLHSADIARFWPYATTREFVRARSAEGFNKTYGIVHPREQSESMRGVRRSPMHSWHAQQQAFFFEAAGWERPQWYESHRQLVAEFAGQVTERTAEWDRRWWSPVIEAEHLALRARGGVVDLSSFTVLDVHGPGAVGALERLAVRRLDVPVGRVVYTPFLDEDGGMVSDLTVMRLGENHLRVVTGGVTGPTDRSWIRAHLPEDGSVTVVDQSSGVTTIGVWGPAARRLVSSLSPVDLSSAGFPFGTCRTVRIAGQPVLASRISYVGESGWELYVPSEQAPRLWEELIGAGEALGVGPVGLGVYGTTARLEKSYRSYGHDLNQDYSVVEAGLAPVKVKAAPFIGRQAMVDQLAAGPRALMCTVSVDPRPISGGEPGYPTGNEPVLDSEGRRLVDSLGRPSYLTSAGPGPSVGAYLALAYLPIEHATAGTGLQVEYLARRHRATILAVGATAVFDPENQRLRS